MGRVLFKAFALVLIFCASRIESTESIVSNSSRQLLILLVWRCPINRFVSPGISSNDSNFWVASCALFSPMASIPTS